MIPYHGGPFSDSRIAAEIYRNRPKEELEAMAKADEKVKPFVDGKQIVKIVVVPDKLVNIVVRQG